jgi:tRNA(Ile)-lysidine synthetase-like protein
MKNFNHNLINKNDILLLAISGGIDSMVLLHYLYHLKEDLSISLMVAHVDHDVRLNSHKDAQLVESTCDKLNIPFYLKKLKDEDYDNFHDYAHKKRYDFFAQIAKEIGANKIVLAHHLDDLAETIVMRLIRGSSYEGYRGILESSVYDQIDIIRPMLYVSKEDIINYQNEHHILYNQDESNLKDKYTRNRYRHQIMPLLEQENPKYKDKLVQFADYQKKSYQMIDYYASQYIETLDLSKSSIHINIQGFLNQFDLVRMDILKKIINQLTHNKLELTYGNLLDMIDVFKSQKAHLNYAIGDHLFLYKSYDVVSIQTKEKKQIQFNIQLNDFGDFHIKDRYDVNISKKPNKNYDYIYKLCYNNLDLLFPLTMRNRRDGDTLDIKIGTKKLKDFFIDHKVPKDQRDQLPLLINKDNEILFIPGLFQKKENGNQSIYINIKKANI